MPTAPLVPCAHPGCPGLVTRGRCADHRRPDERPNSAQRGLGTAWKGARLAVLMEEPWCRACAKHGRPELAREVDHIVPRHLGGTDARENLQPLCTACHERKSTREQQDMRRAAGA